MIRCAAALHFKSRTLVVGASAVTRTALPTARVAHAPRSTPTCRLAESSPSPRGTSGRGACRSWPHDRKRLADLPEKSAEPLHGRRQGQIVPTLPLRDCALVETGALSEPFLGEAGGAPGGPQDFGEWPGVRRRLVSQKRNDGRQVPSLGLRTIPLPMPNGALRHSEAIGSILLKEPEVDPTLAEVVAEGPQFGRICGILGLLRPKCQVAKGQ